MTSSPTPEGSLARLLKMIPPPVVPLEVGDESAALTYSSGEPVVFPPDYLPLMKRYGSGCFETEGDVSMIVELCNPFASVYRGFIEDEHTFFNQYKRDEGGGFSAYEIFPTKGGLLEWGWAEGRKHFFWLTEGDPAQWPIVILWDMEFLARIDLPLTDYLAQLIAGDIPCGFIGDETKPVHLDPTRITFEPRAMPKN